MSETIVASFVLRFVVDDAGGNVVKIAPWRGSIRHVQSNEEFRFAHLPDALQFVARFVDIEPPVDDETLGLQ